MGCAKPEQMRYQNNTTDDNISKYFEGHSFQSRMDGRWEHAAKGMCGVVGRAEPEALRRYSALRKHVSPPIPKPLHAHSRSSLRLLHTLLVAVAVHDELTRCPPCRPLLSQGLRSTYVWLPPSLVALFALPHKVRLQPHYDGFILTVLCLHHWLVLLKYSVLARYSSSEAAYVPGGRAYHDPCENSALTLLSLPHSHLQGNRQRSYNFPSTK